VNPAGSHTSLPLVATAADEADRKDNKGSLKDDP
jgi:hypothetical protein